VLTWSRGSIGVVGSVFEVMTQVDLGLTNVDRFDSADSAINAMTLIKNLGCHNCVFHMYMQQEDKAMVMTLYMTVVKQHS
jgi:hypothetical protein